MKRFLLIIVSLVSFQHAFTQTVLTDVLRANRKKLYSNIVRYTINTNLKGALADSTEEDWQDAFRAMELIHYRSPWIDNRIRIGINDLQNRSIDFQRAMLELIYCMYPTQYSKQVDSLLEQTSSTKIFAMCAEYLLIADTSDAGRRSLNEKAFRKQQSATDDPFLKQLEYQLQPNDDKKTPGAIYKFLEKKYLAGNILLISFQRKDRNYPGLAMVRDGNGNFIKDYDGKYFAVPQLARSMTNLPGYLTNGNTPEGIFRMEGFDNSASSFIGPTANIQLTMPFELRPSHFYRNENLSDSDWSLNMYKHLLPENFRNYMPMLQTYYAGKAGRVEIIAHGTTIDPEYYEGKPYYPLTPTQGCLCTKEIWSETTGTLLESDQQKLSGAITKAGGPHGYAIVININDKEEPVTINDILPFLKLAGQN
ncbi:hypothetical protein BH11BAC4_BH11BAC4_07870 [soil metagenome]